MIWVQYLLIVLLAVPFIAISTALYIHLLKYVASRNREDKVAGRK